MRLPIWNRDLLRTRRRRAKGALRDCLRDSVRLSIRRLEERRVLDVTAAFTSATGELEIALTNTTETATVSSTAGNIVVTDKNNNVVDINVDGGGPGAVTINEVDRLQVTGDAVAGQAIVFDTFLVPRNGLAVDSQVERAVFNETITRVVSGGIQIAAPTIELGADLEATGLDIVLGGDVVLTSDVALTAQNAIFGGRVDDDGNSNTGSALHIAADGLTQFDGTVGGDQAIDRLETDQPGQTRVGADITVAGNTIVFNDPVELTSSVSITDHGTGIEFNSTVDSAAGSHHSLTVAATSGRVTFRGDIGDGAAGDQTLGMLTVSEAATGVLFGADVGLSQIRTDQAIDIGSVPGGIGGVGVVFNGGAARLLTMTTTGDQVRINGATVLETDLDIVTGGGDVIFTADAPIDSQTDTTRRLTVNAGAGRVEFNEDIGAGVALSGLVVVRADTGVRFGGADTEIPGSGGAGPVELVNTTGPVDIGVGPNEIGGSGVTWNAGGAVFRVTTTGDGVRINGRVTAQSDASIDTGPSGGDIVFTSAATIDSQAAETSNLQFNAGTGGLFFNNDLGANVDLGLLEVLSAAAGVTFGEADSDTGPGGRGPVNTIRAAGGINIGVGSEVIQGTGITLNGGANPLLVQTSDRDARFNGALTLASDVMIRTGTGPGDIVFTNDTPVDSQLGELHDLELDAGSGSVRANEDLGGTQSLAALRVVRADGGVRLGEATIETPGSGGTGPVEVINADQAIDIGVGANVILGGILLNGGAITGQTFTTTGDSVRLNGPTRLGTPVMIDTGAGPGDILFTNDTPLDSLAGKTSDLTLIAGAGSVSINEDIGSSDPLGALRVVRADGGVAIGGASSETPGAGGTGPVNLVRTDRPIDIGVGASVIGGAGIALNGGNAPLTIRTSEDNIRLNGAVLLQSDLQLHTSDGKGDVTFTSAATIDSSDGPESATGNERNSLFVDVGDGAVLFNANLGASQRIGELTIDRAAKGVVFGQADVASLGGTGPVTQVLTDGAIDLGTGTTPDDIISGKIVFNGGAAPILVQTTDDDIRLNGPTELGSHTTFDTGAGDGDLLATINASIDSAAAEANDLVVTLDGGDATFQAALGQQRPLGELRTVSLRDFTAQAAIRAARISQAAGSGTTTYHAVLRTTAPGQPGLQLTGTHFVFNAPVATTGDGRVTITHSGLLDIADAANMDLDGAFLENGGGMVQTAADIVTSGDTIHFTSLVTLTDGAAANVLLDTTADGFTLGADITFDETLNGETALQEQIRLNAGSSGNVDFRAEIGDATRLETLRILNANDVDAAGAVRVGNLRQDAGQGTTTFSATIDTVSPTEIGIDLNTVNVTLNDAVTTSGAGRVEITVTNLLTINAAADMTLSGAFRQDGGGSVATSADITTSEDDITFLGAVVARDDLRFDTGAGAGDMRFADSLNGLVDCQQNLTFLAGLGDMDFEGPIGFIVNPGDQSLVLDNAPGDFVIQTVDDAPFHSAVRVNRFTQLAGTGETRFDGPVTIKSVAGIDLVTDSVTLNGPLDTSAAGGPVTIDVTNDISINGQVSSGAGPVNLLADDDVLFGAQGEIQTTGAPVTIRADADVLADDGSGGAVLMQDGAIVSTGSGRIEVFADENIELGRLVNTTSIFLRSFNGGIVDVGDAGSPDLETFSLAIHTSHGVGAQDRLETFISVLAVRNELDGGVHLFNENPGLLIIGDADGLSGILNGPQTPANLDSVVDSDIDISNRGPIQVGSDQRVEGSDVTQIIADAIRNHAGGDTILRTGLGSDLVILAPIQNRGGDGWIVLFSGNDLFIFDSMPEFTSNGAVDGTPLPESSGGLPVAQGEITVENRGAIRGEARREVMVDVGEPFNGNPNIAANYAIIRTHAERFPTTAPDPPSPASFTEIPPRENPGVGQREFLEIFQQQLIDIRNTTAGQATLFPGLVTIQPVDFGGSTVDERGRAILRITIGDSFHLETNWQVTVNWGDGQIENFPIAGNPRATNRFRDSDQNLLVRQPDATVTPRFDSGTLQGGGRVTGLYFAHHTYLSNPNPDDPSAPIRVVVQLRYDARPEGELEFDRARSVGTELFAPPGVFGIGSGVFNGIRFFENVTQEILGTAITFFDAPGIGQTTFIKVIESEIVPVEFREVTVQFVVIATRSFVVQRGAGVEFVVATFEAEIFGDFQLILKIYDDVAELELDDEYLLPLDVLEDPIGLFTKRFEFPDGHYRIYLEEIQTRRRRLIIEVHVFQARVVPPDFREGAGERQPGAIQQQPQEEGAAAPEADAQTRIDERPAAAADERAVLEWAGQRRGKRASAPAAAGQVVAASGGALVLALQDQWKDRLDRLMASGKHQIRKTSRRKRRAR